MDTKDEYVPTEPKFYNYKAKNSLTLYLSNDIQTFNKISLVVYTVKNARTNPFLNILLHKPKGKDKLELLQIPVTKKMDQNELINSSKLVLYKMFLLDDYDAFIETILFNGFFICENNLYLFFDASNCKFNFNDTYSSSLLRFALIDEIVNYQNVCNIPVNETVCNLFIENEDLCFLTNEKDENIETPVVGFIGTTKNKLMFKYVFGESSQNKNAIFGPYFYFTNFYNATNGGHECIIRFALFIGCVKYVENHLYDPIDDSEIKKQRLDDPELEKNMEQLTMRISDHDGVWSELFDSIYLGDVELDNGTHLKDVPIIAVKEYQQQFPLTYHYTDKNKKNSIL
jgi:hypothetical protein